ncbi:hypothetical protein ACFE04_030295 [Oxalis oulophora]
MALPLEMTIWTAKTVWLALIGWVSSCLTIADEIANSIRSGDIGPFHVGILMNEKDYSLSADIARSNWVITKFSRDGKLNEARKLFDELPERDVVTWATLISGYVKYGSFDEARRLFSRCDAIKNVVSWTAMLGGILEAKRLFDEMPKKDVISYTSMVTGLARNGQIDDAREIFDRMPERNIVSWNAMITAYSQNRRITEAFELFEKMLNRDSPSWNTMITGFIQNGELSRARKLFDSMPRKNVVSYTTMITGYVQAGESEDGLRIFSQMLSDSSERPNEGTFVTVLSACSDLAGLTEGRQIHQFISKTVYQNSQFVVSALIHMYSKCGELSTARRMFDDISQRDLVAWNGMIAAYTRHGHGKEAIALFNEMKCLGFKPNDVTYIELLSACSHTGLVNEGLKFFEELRRDSSIQLRDDHYACLVDLCGRAGKLKEAFNFINQLGNKASSSVWEALVAGCNVHRDMDTGKLAAKKLLEAEPENAGTYLLLSNIYASAGKWKEAAKVRSDMKDKGLKKQPGCSWIEVDNKVHVFVVGDKSYCQSDIVRSLIRDLHMKMKRTELVIRDGEILDEDLAGNFNGICVL